MPDRKNHRRRRRLLLRGLLLMLLVVVIASTLVLRRLHFSHQDFPRLARLQGSFQTTPSERPTAPQIIGHRGSGLESTDPQADKANAVIGNTQRAIELAIAQVDWIEIDIRQAHSGELIVFHDEDVQAKTTRREPGLVSDLSLSALKQVDLLVNPPEKILTLDEVFQQFHSVDRKWILDVKTDGLEKKLTAWISENLEKEQFILLGTYEVLKAYQDSGYTLAYVASWRTSRWLGLWRPGEIIRRCGELRCDYLVIPIILADPDLIRAARSRGVSVWVYGTENAQDWDDAQRLGTDGLIVDHPAKAVKHFAK